jgi:uncharacterized RDD family membrane protein YckC
VSTDEPSVSRSGLPASGPGSPASWSRRFVALLVDWALANAAAFIIAGGQVWEVQGGMAWLPLACWFGLVWLGTVFTGASFGQWLLRIRIVSLRGGRVGVMQAAVRTALILLILPPLIFDREGRGLHDLATNTAAVNGPGTRST